jgi:hypothetical protein
MQDVASEVLKMNRGQVKGEKGITIQAWKALQAQKDFDKRMAKMEAEKLAKQSEISSLKLENDSLQLENEQKIDQWNEVEVLRVNQENKLAELKQTITDSEDDINEIRKFKELTKHIPDKFTDGNNQDIWLLLEAKLLLLWGGIKRLMGVALPSGIIPEEGVFAYFCKRTNNLNIHSDTTKVKAESEFPAIKGGLKLKKEVIFKKPEIKTPNKQVKSKLG